MRLQVVELHQPLFGVDFVPWTPRPGASTKGKGKGEGKGEGKMEGPEAWEKGKAEAPGGLQALLKF